MKIILLFYKGNEPINIEKPIHSKIFPICIGIENLMMITQNLKTAKLQDIFKENQYPWAVNLLELEVILDCIEYPSLFINYIQARLEAQKKEKPLIQTTDELTYFGMYLKEGPYGNFNFSNEPSAIFLDSSYIAPFDKYYLQMKSEKPKMNLDLRLRRFIHEWETLKLKNQLFSKNLSMINNQSTNTSPDIADILYYLLYFNAPTLRDFFDKVEYCIQKTKQDKKHHNCCFVAKDFCLNFHSSTNVGELDKHMLGYANLKNINKKKMLY